MGNLLGWTALLNLLKVFIEVFKRVMAGTPPDQADKGFTDPDTGDFIHNDPNVDPPPFHTDPKQDDWIWNVFNKVKKPKDR
jgi:hypothetical protein